MHDRELLPIVQLHTGLRWKSFRLFLFKILFDAAKGDLKNNTAEWENNSSITVVMAAKNYPNEPRLNDEIHGLSSKNKDTYIFHAGTKLTNNKIVNKINRLIDFILSPIKKLEDIVWFYQAT